MLALQASAALYEGDGYQKREAYCGGVFLSDRLVLTAWHCVHLRHFVDQTLFEAWNEKTATGERVIAANRGYDVAVVRLKEPIKGIRAATVTEDVMPGDDLVTVGSMDGEPFTVSRLTVSKVLPDVQFVSCNPKEASGDASHQAIQVTGLIWSGNSGGGGFDAEGRLVGVLTHMHMSGVTECAKDWDESRDDEEPMGVVLDNGGPLWAWLVGPAALNEFLGAVSP